MAQTVLRVRGMTCPGCENTIRAFLMREAGVQEVDVSYGKGSARVQFDEAVTSPERIASARIFRGSYGAEVGE